MLAALLCLSGISLAVVVAATSSNNTLVVGPKTKVSSPKSKLSTDRPTTAKSAKPSGPAVPAPNPPSGTLSPANPTITYTDGPLITNTTGILGPPVCSAPGLCSDFMLTVNAASVAATQQIFIEGTWTPAQNDFDYFIENTSGQVIAANQSTANPSALILPIPADGTVYHIVTEASLGAGNLSFVVKLINKPNPVNQGPGVPPRYMNYPSGTGQADDAGEPSIGVDWNPNVASLKHGLVNTGGMAFFTSNFNQYQASFDDCSSPAVNPWTDVTDPNEQITSLDPIGFTDHYTTAALGTSYPPPHTPGRTFQAQLAAGDSITSFTDDDGATHTPSQGGGIPAGPDHETVGGGPFHSPVPTPPSPAYPNAIYYCSQSLTEAECSRSDDGGVTFGPGVTIYNQAQCLGGIHGHVKVSPQGTVYVPNSSCGVGSPPGVDGVAVSTNNGITWNSFAVPSSTGSQDPSVAIGQNNVGKPSGQVPNTIYLGWVGADGHAHAAHSPDEGATWQDDIDVGSILGVQNAVFPAVVAGDDNRAAFGFLGTTTSGAAAFSDDGSFHGIWHLYIATTYDRGHSWILIDATPDDPVQTGQVCLKGTGCGAARNLLDFNDFTVDAQGRGLFGYADGCVNCINTFGGQSRQAKGTIARQSGGRRLFAAFDPVEPGLPAAPQVISPAVRVSGPPAGVLVSWMEPDNGGSPITGYRIYRGNTSGTETFLAAVSGETTNKFLDQTANSSGNYFYRVTAVNGVGEGPFCREVSINITTGSGNACVAPYIQLAGAGIAGNISPDPSQGELTIQHINVGEPFTSCTDNSVTFTMKVATLDPANTGQPVLPSNAEWKFNFVVTTPDNVDHEMFVSMDTFAFNNASTASPNFSYGRKDPTPTGTQEQMECFEQSAGGVEIFHCPNLANGTTPSASFTKDGTITIKLNFSTPLNFSAAQAPGTGSAFTWDGSAVGTKLKHVRGTTVLLAGVFLEVVQTTGVFPETATGCPTCPDYTRIGNVAGCNTSIPLAVLTGSPVSGMAPLTVHFDGSGSSEPPGSCGTINSYTMDFGDGSNPVTQSSPMFNHTYNNSGDYPARLTVQDTAGHASTNLAQVVVSVTSTPPVLSSVVSRKTHNTSPPSTFDINLPLTGTRAVECRSGGTDNNYTLVFTFANNLTSVGNVGMASGIGSVVSSGIGPGLNQYTVNLSGVNNAQYISVALVNAKDHTGATGDVISPQVGILVGDVDHSGRVDSTDVFQVRQNSLQTAGSSNFQTDVDTSGRIDSTDVFQTRQDSLAALPTPP
jgi:PKD domain/Dockerin type I domain